METHVAGGDALVEHLVGGLVVAALFQQVAGAQVTGPAGFDATSLQG